MVKVLVTQTGHYLKLREPGEVMDIPEKLFSNRWMKRLKDQSLPIPKEVPLAPAAPHPDSVEVRAAHAKAMRESGRALNLEVVEEGETVTASSSSEPLVVPDVSLPPNATRTGGSRNVLG